MRRFVVFAVALCLLWCAIFALGEAETPMDVEWEFIGEDLPCEAKETDAAFTPKSDAEALSILADRTTLGVGEQVQLGIEGGASAVFSCDNAKVLRVTAAGAVKALRVGACTVTAVSADGASMGMIGFTVIAAPTKVTVSLPRVKLGAGETLRALAQTNAEGDWVPTWTSSKPAVLSCGTDGTLTALAPGKATVSARFYNGKTGKVTVQVVAAPKAIAFPGEGLRLGAGDVRPWAAQPDTAGEVRYTSENEGVAIVDEYGTVTAIAPGKTAVVAQSYNGLRASCTVEVTPAPVALAFDLKDVYGVGESFPPVYAADPTDCALGDVALTSAAPKLLQVRPDGTLKALKVGEAVLTATAYNGVQATKAIRIVKAPSKVTVRAPRTVWAVGERFSPEASFGDGMNWDVTWASSNEKVLRCEDGRFTAVGVGKATISAKAYNGKKGTLAIKVVAAPTSVRFEKSEIALAAGDACANPAAVNTAGAVEYTSSDESVATVDENGRIAAMAEGEARIAARSYNGLTAVCTVCVAPELQGFAFADDRSAYGVGEVVAPTLRFEPSESRAATVRFETDDPKIAKLQSDGSVKFLRAGEVTLRAVAYNGIEAERRITVVKAPSKVVLTAPGTSLVVGESMPLQAEVIGLDCGCAFSSGNAAVLRVDENGVVTALKTGTATITAKAYNGKKATLRLTAVAGPTTLEWNRAFDLYNPCAVGVGDTFSLGAKTDADAVGAIEYRSSAPDVVRVDGNGTVTVLAPGRAVVTARTRNGLEKSVECNAVGAWGEALLYAEGAEESLNPAYDYAMALQKGQTVRLEPYFRELDYSTWSASVVEGGSFVSVAGDALRGVKAGAAVVRIAMFDGSTMELYVEVCS